MAPIKVTAESSISLFSLLLSTWGSGLSAFSCAVLCFRFWVYPFLPPMSPKSLVIQLRGTVEEAIALFQEHGRLLLANAADINIQLIRLEADTCALERALLDDQRLSLTNCDSLVFYLRQEKYIWVNAYRYRRKICALKNRMEDREGKLRDAVARRCSGLAMNYNGREASRPLCRCSGGDDCQVSYSRKRRLEAFISYYRMHRRTSRISRGENEVIYLSAVNLNAAGANVNTGR
ncbi:hypothetical protein EDD85DRAFT_784879 [Armillaria nabsnona]|nr:hypothetical protein EDD85DRAFT_784879 [Armillaria nabsnona]